MALAACVWGISESAALLKLARSDVGLDPEFANAETVDAYLDGEPKKRQAYRAFWEDAQRYFSAQQSVEFRKLKVRLRIHASTSPEQWTNGPGQLVGAYPYRDIRAVIAPGCSSFARKGYKTVRLTRGKVRGGEGGDGGGKRYFVGRDWGDVLVFPYHDAPGRLSGFQFIGRQARPEDCSFWGLPRARSEAGLAGLQTTETVHPEFGTHVFAVDNPALALRLQIRNTGSSLVNLPIVSWYDQGRTYSHDVWNTLQHRHVIFWGWTMSAALIRQASLCDGRIALVPLDADNPDTVDHYLRLKPPRDLLGRAVKRARPWQDALAAWAAKQPPSAVESLLLDLENRQMDVTAIAAILGPFAVTLATAPMTRTARVGDREVRETADGWTVRASGKKPYQAFSTAIVRIDRIVTETITHYQGRVIYQGYVLPFSIPAETFEREAVLQVCLLCVNAGLGRPTIHGSASQLIAAAMAFRTPEAYQVVPDRENAS